ncbi:MAG TPA: hypothetical protein VNE16_01145 [Vicinamibacterales bacterium]|nr:hypothetical protein [Vicinamibacterales bacterium]
MPETKECPLCGERMRLHEAQTVESIPGTGQTIPRTLREWRCPDCDYFEETDEPAARP